MLNEKLNGNRKWNAEDGNITPEIKIPDVVEPALPYY